MRINASKIKRNIIDTICFDVSTFYHRKKRKKRYFSQTTRIAKKPSTLLSRLNFRERRISFRPVGRKTEVSTNERNRRKIRARWRGEPQWESSVYKDTDGMWNKWEGGKRVKGAGMGPQEYSRRAYRYTTPSAINISGKGGPTWAGSKGTVAKSWAWHLQWNEERIHPVLFPPCPLRLRLILFVLSGPNLPFHHPLTSFSLVYTTVLLDLPDVEVHFIPTFNKASWPLRGFIKNWGCNLPRGPPSAANVL